MCTRLNFRAHILQKIRGNTGDEDLFLALHFGITLETERAPLPLKILGTSVCGYLYNNNINMVFVAFNNNMVFI